MIHALREADLMIEKEEIHEKRGGLRWVEEVQLEAERRVRSLLQNFTNLIEPYSITCRLNKIGF